MSIKLLHFYWQLEVDTTIVHDIWGQQRRLNEDKNVRSKR